ncbi:MAG TPA: tryptophan 2,3-dioxygenase family protein [Pyrinomonadaceae bacterium]|nr:tryptophan 2,3-dioxygenase family protein [Pyrinomonadaceae bacterium]
MSSNYGANSLLSYNKYLRVQDLIQLQECLSDPAHHDELLFITVHQAYELWFKQILHEIDAAITLLGEDRVPAATRALRRVVDIEKLLLNQIHILESMTPINFLAFRDQLNPASGFQSMQFREIEFSSGLKDESIAREFANDPFASERLKARLAQPTLADVFYQVLERRGFDVKHRAKAVLEILTHFEDRYEEFQLAEALLEHDEYFSLWRSHHIRMVERMVGAKRGTGGSEGIGYLKTTLDKKFYPDIWEARTYLDVKHGSSGCPFAH